MKEVILGTAGHIDHGKTSLIRALTGIDTDRLKEEKTRGITIELGFAYIELPSGRQVGIVDVPGHEKFMKNMVAGASGIDCVALMVAADEGVMPQTREHLEVCELLNIRHGLTVLTKIDVVDEEWLELVREDVSDFLSGTFLAECPIVETSSVTGQGLEELLRKLDEVVGGIPQREEGYIFRLPIDRVFSMKGFGTVVTGTSISGKIKTGDEVTCYPEGIHSKVRGLQVYKREVQEVGAGLRTAINLQGIEKSTIRRGDIVAAKNSLFSTYMVDVHFRLLPSAPKKLNNRARVRFHAGTAEIISTIILLDRDVLEKGESCFAQIRLEQPTALLRGDHYVLRSYSPMYTIGGGEVLNALPKKKKRFSKEALSELKALYTGEPQEMVEIFVYQGRFKGVERAELSFLTNEHRDSLDGLIKELSSRGKIIQYDKERGSLVHKHFLSKAREEILETIGRYHEDFPLRVGLQKEELRSRTVGARNPRLFGYVVSLLNKEGLVIQDKEIIRLRDHQVTLAQDQEETRRELEETYERSGLQPPYFKEIKNKLSGNKGSEILELMVKDGILVKIKEDLYFHHRPLGDLKNRLVEYLREHGEITAPEFKDITGVSRKYAIPLLEYFDRIQITVRVGDSRVLRKK